MARGQAFDYLHSMRFHVSVIDPTNPVRTVNPDAGFSSCTVPEVTIDPVEYREGQFLYTRKYPGIPSYNDVTMMRGVARRDSGFWDWIRRVIEGTQEYRTEIEIQHFHRIDTLPGPSLAPAENINLTSPAKVYRLWQAFPSRHKFSADLDATDSSVSIMELDVAYEHCEMQEPT